MDTDIYSDKKEAAAKTRLEEIERSFKKMVELENEHIYLMTMMMLVDYYDSNPDRWDAWDGVKALFDFWGDTYKDKSLNRQMVYDNAINSDHLALALDRQKISNDFLKSFKASISKHLEEKEAEHIPEIIRESLKKGGFPVGAFAASASITSPFLPPDWVRTYEELHPRFIQSTLNLVDKEADNRHKCQNKDIDNSHELARSGQDKAFYLFVMVLIIGTAVLFWKSLLYGALIIGAVVFALILGALSHRQSSPKDSTIRLPLKKQLKKMLPDKNPDQE